MAYTNFRFISYSEILVNLKLFFLVTENQFRDFCFLCNDDDDDDDDENDDDDNDDNDNDDYDDPHAAPCVKALTKAMWMRNKKKAFT